MLEGWRERESLDRRREGEEGNNKYKLFIEVLKGYAFCVYKEGEEVRDI